MAPPLLASRALVLQGAAVLPVLVGCRVRSSVGARAAARTARWLWATKGRGALTTLYQHTHKHPFYP